MNLEQIILFRFAQRRAIKIIVNVTLVGPATSHNAHKNAMALSIVLIMPYIKDMPGNVMHNGLGRSLTKISNAMPWISVPVTGLPSLKTWAEMTFAPLSLQTSAMSLRSTLMPIASSRSRPFRIAVGEHTCVSTTCFFVASRTSSFGQYTSSAASRPST